MNSEQEKSLRENIRQLNSSCQAKKKIKEQKMLLEEEEQLRTIIRSLINHELKYLKEIVDTRY